jgi:hypothetical protein
MAPPRPKPSDILRAQVDEADIEVKGMFQVLYENALEKESKAEAAEVKTNLESHEVLLQSTSAMTDEDLVASAAVIRGLIYWHLHDVVPDKKKLHAEVVDLRSTIVDLRSTIAKMERQRAEDWQAMAKFLKDHVSQ